MKAKYGMSPEAEYLTNLALRNHESRGDRCAADDLAGVSEDLAWLKRAFGEYLYARAVNRDDPVAEQMIEMGFADAAHPMGPADPIMRFANCLTAAAFILAGLFVGATFACCLWSDSAEPYTVVLLQRFLDWANTAGALGAWADIFVPASVWVTTAWLLEQLLSRQLD